MSSLLSQRVQGKARPTKWNDGDFFFDAMVSERVSYRCFDTAFSTKEISQRIKKADAPYLKLLAEAIIPSEVSAELVLL